MVLRGAGRSFCAGNDLEDIAAGRRSQDPHFRGKTIERLARIPQPLVAAIHGHCYTGGLELALAADLLIATETARFADTHGKWGLTPLWGMSQRLPRRVGCCENTVAKVMKAAGIRAKTAKKLIRPRRGIHSIPKPCV